MSMSSELGLGLSEISHHASSQNSSSTSNETAFTSNADVPVLSGSSTSNDFHDNSIRKNVTKKRKVLDTNNISTTDSGYIRAISEAFPASSPLAYVSEDTVTFIKGYEKYLPSPDDDKPCTILNAAAIVETSPAKINFVMDIAKVKKLMETSSWKGITRHQEKNIFVRVVTSVYEDGQTKKILEDIFINQHLQIIYSLMLCWLSERKETREMMSKPDDYVSLIKKVSQIKIVV